MRNFNWTIRQLFCLFAIILPALAVAQSNESKITDVTILLDGAHITRVANIKGYSGSTSLKFSGLSASLNPSTIRIEGNENIKIASVSHTIDHLNEADVPASIKTLQDDLKQVELSIQKTHANVDVLNHEQQMILANQQAGGKQAGIAIETVMDLAEFYSERLTDIETKKIHLNRELKSLKERQLQLKKQLQEENSGLNRQTSTIIINASISNSSSTTLSFSYMVNNAGWRPFYHIYANELDQPLSLGYKAYVWQQTGINWDDVNLTLSTGNANTSGTKPTVTPWYVQFEQPVVYKREDVRKKSARAAEPMAEADEAQLEEVVVKLDNRSLSVANNVTVSNNGIHNQFSINQPYSITSDGQEYMVDVQEQEMDATYEYVCIPRYDQSVFLAAMVPQWSQYNMLPGHANTYINGTLVGKAYINSAVTNDTLSLSLGRDQNLIVRYNRQKQHQRAGVTNKGQKIKMNTEIVIKNTYSRAIPVVIKDMMPISSSKEISIELLESNGAQLNEKTGELIWKTTIQSKKGITTGYSTLIKSSNQNPLNL